MVGFGQSRKRIEITIRKRFVGADMEGKCVIVCRQQITQVSWITAEDEGRRAKDPFYRARYRCELCQVEHCQSESTVRSAPRAMDEWPSSIVMGQSYFCVTRPFPT